MMPIDRLADMEEKLRILEDLNMIYIRQIALSLKVKPFIFTLYRELFLLWLLYTFGKLFYWEIYSASYTFCHYVCFLEIKPMASICSMLYLS